MKKFDFHPIFCHVYGGVALLATFGVYVRTLAPTVSFYDSGELISAAYTFGVAHPPGYPLYVLLGWLFSKIPIGSVAFRLNMMSAWFAALAAMMAYYVTYAVITCPSADAEPAQTARTMHPERVLHPVLALFTALLFAFSLTHWRQALMAEVYSLNAFLGGLVTLLLLQWHLRAGRSADRSADIPAGANMADAPVPQDADSAVGAPNRTPNDWRLYLVALIFGLGFGNHQTIALLAVAAVFLVLVTDWRILLRWKALLLIALFLGLGFSVYLQIPIGASTNSPVNWGNPVTWRQFTWLVTREGYQHVERGDAVRKFWQTLTGHPEAMAEPAANDETMDPATASGGTGASDVPQMAAPSETPAASGASAAQAHRLRDSLLVRQIATYNPIREFGYFAAALALIGLGYGLAVFRVPTLTLLLAILTLVVVIIVIADPPDENVFLVEEFHVPAYLLFSVLIGIGMLAIVRGVLWMIGGGMLLQYGTVFVMTVAFLVLPATQMLKHVRTVDRSRNYVAYDYGRNILDSLQPRAMLFTWGDSGAFPLWYLQYVEGVRPDVTLIHVPHLGTDWFVDGLPQDLFFTVDPFNAFEGDLLLLIDDIVRKNVFDRPIYFDYSSLHALPLPYEVLPHGLTYKIALPGETFDETVWPRYRFRGLMSFSLSARDLERLRQEAQIPEDIATPLTPLVDWVFESQAEFLHAVEQQIGPERTRKYQEFILIHALFRPTIAHDPDIDRTFLMYGSARTELGHFYMERGELEKAAAEFNAAVRFDSSLGDGIVEMLQFNDKIGGSSYQEPNQQERQ